MDRCTLVVIRTPTHLLQNSTTWTDLDFTNQPHFVMGSGVHNSLYRTCHHETVFTKLNLNIEYPSPYEHILRGYSRAYKASTNRVINAIDLKDLFANKTMESQVSQLNDILLDTGVDKFLFRRPIFGGSILLTRPIGHSKKWLLKTKVHVRSRHN